MLVPEIVAAGGGLLFAFDHATIAGKLVLTLLAVDFHFQLVDHDHEIARDPVCPKTERAFPRRFPARSTAAASI